MTAREQKRLAEQVQAATDDTNREINEYSAWHRMGGYLPL